MSITIMAANQLIDKGRLTLIGFIVVGNSFLTLTLPVLANEEPPTKVFEEVDPLETPTGNIQDLGILEVNETQQQQWGILDDNQTNRGEIKYEIDPRTVENSPSVDIQKEQQEWQDLHRGDPRNSGGGFSITEF